MPCAADTGCYFNRKDEDMGIIKPDIINIPPIMTRKDLQQILKISKNTALELLQSRQIDSFIAKGRYRITRDSLIQFIEKSSFFC